MRSRRRRRRRRHHRCCCCEPKRVGLCFAFRHAERTASDLVVVVLHHLPTVRLDHLLSLRRMKMILTGRTSFPPLCCTFQIPAQSHQSGSEAPPPPHRTIPRISLTHGRLPATTYPLAEICFRSANANKKPQLDPPPTTHLPHSFISGWPAQQLPPLLPSFLLSTAIH